MNWLLSLKSRTKDGPQAETTSLKKALSVFLPVIVYYLVDTLIVMLGAMLIKYEAESDAGIAAFCRENSNILSVIIKVLAMSAAAGLLIPAFKGERPVLFYKEIKANRYLIVALTGASTALFFNLLFALTGFTGISAEYSAVSEKQFSLPLIIGILLYGIFTPIVEELLFRGLVYNRLRRNYGLITAVTASSLLFGLYHMNLVQAVYGSILGLLLAWIYERYGGFVFPVIVHGVANSLIYICMTVEPIKKSILNPGAMLISLILMLIGIVFIGRDSEERLS